MCSFWFYFIFCFLIGRMFSLWGSHSSENAGHSDDLLAEVCWYHIAIFESWWASEKVGTLGDTKVETGSILLMWAGMSWRWRVWQSEWPNPRYVISTSISKIWFNYVCSTWKSLNLLRVRCWFVSCRPVEVATLQPPWSWAPNGDLGDWFI